MSHIVLMNITSSQNVLINIMYSYEAIRVRAGCFQGDASLRSHWSSWIPLLTPICNTGVGGVFLPISKAIAILSSELQLGSPRGRPVPSPCCRFLLSWTRWYRSHEAGTDGWGFWFVHLCLTRLAVAFAHVSMVVSFRGFRRFSLGSFPHSMHLLYMPE